MTDDVCLHQVVARSPGRLRHYADLPLALAAPPADADEWRIHTHVPVSADPAGPLGTTQHDVTALLAALAKTPIVRQFEVETYTWDVLPAISRTDAADTAHGLAAELNHAQAILDRLRS